MRNRTPKEFLLLSALTLLAGAAWIAISAPEPSRLESSQSAPSVGFLAPNFSLGSLDGETIQLSDLRGQAVILNLWASWCGPCRAEMPAIQNVYEAYADKGLVILALNATYQDDLASASAFAAELGLTYPILLDLDGSVSSQYNLRALPTTYFIDPEGRVQDVVIGGPMSEALLEIRAEELMRGLR